GHPADRVTAQADRAFEQATVTTVPRSPAPDKPITVDRKRLDPTAFEQLVLAAQPLAESTVIISNTGTGVRSGSLDIHFGEGLNRTLISLQEWYDDAVEVSQHSAVVGKDATFKSVLITLRGDLVRLSPKVSYSGRGGSAELYGLYFAGDKQ